MPRSAASILASTLAAALLLAAAGCGEEDAELLPGSTAREITTNLDTVQQLADEGDCLGAESAALQVGEQVEALEGVDQRLKRALAQGAERLEEVVARCEEEVEAEPLPSELEGEEEEDAGQLEKEAEQEEKEQEKREKEEEKSEKSEDGDEGQGNGPPPSVPPAEGEGDEGEGGGPPPAVEEDGSSGGVSPANPAGEG